MPDEKPRPAAISRQGWLLVIGLGIWFVGTGVPAVLFELYLAALGLNRTSIGWMTLAHNLGGALMAPLAAWLMDRLGQRRAILTGAAIGIAAWAGTLLIPQLEAMLILYAISGFGLVMYALTVVPLAAMLSTPANRTRLFSVSEGVSTIAAVAGNLLAGVLPAALALGLAARADSAEAYRAALLVSLGIRVIALLPLARLHPPELPHEAGPDGALAPVRRMAALRYFDPRVLIKLRTPVFRYALPLAIIFFGGSMVARFLTLILRDRFGVSDQFLSMLLAAMNLSMGVATFAGPWFAQRLGRVESLVTGAALSVIAYGVVGFSPALAWVVAALVARAAIFNLALPLYRAHIIDRTPPVEYAVVNLILTTAINVGTLAPPISGWLQDRVGLTPIFLIAMGAYAVGAVLLWGIAVGDRAPRTADRGPQPG